MTDQDAGPEEAFALVGNETRAGILRVLGESPYEGMPFSELRAEVDEDIDSGQFNYHLQQLVGRFVEQSADGYTLRPEGINLYRTLRAGTFTRRASVGPFDAGFDCYFCDAAVGASYDDGIFEVQCPDCAHVYAHTMAPPSAAEDATPEELLSRVDQYQRHVTLAFARGVCPNCVNALDAGFISGDEVWAEGTERLDVFVHSECDHCGTAHHMSVGLALLYHPRLISFFYERGLDVTSVPQWELEFAMTDRHVTVRDTDPWKIAFTVTRDGDTLELVVDDDLTVVDSTVS